MDDFGRHYGFYDRQCKTFGTLSKAQAETLDVESKEPVGDIPHFHDMINFFSDKSKQPKDRSTLIHGDFKIDNLVFHKTEPRVIGILDWEMATIGHPLSDLCNVIGPWSWSIGEKLEIESKTSRANPAFEPGATPGLPDLSEVIQWYKNESGYDINKDLLWGVAFGKYLVRVLPSGLTFFRRIQRCCDYARHCSKICHTTSQFSISNGIVSLVLEKQHLLTSD